MSNYEYDPKPDYPFFLCDPQGEGIRFFRTEAERDEAAKKAILEYVDHGEWASEVEEVFVGIVTGVATATNIERPAGDLDEEGMDENGEWWEEETSFRCYFEIQPMAQPTGSDSEGGGE